MSGMAEVLAAHGYSERIRMLDGLFDGGEPRYTCRCGAELGAGWPSHVAAHQAEMLTAAGFGPVKEAGAVALEEAADELERMWLIAATPRRELTDQQWDEYLEFSAYEGDYAAWLRARAAAVRGEG